MIANLAVTARQSCMYTSGGYMGGQFMAKLDVSGGKGDYCLCFKAESVMVDVGG